MATTNGVGSTLPIASLITPATTAPPVASSVTSQLGEDAFLKLLTTQLKNQDPLKPMDDTQSIAQLAQFSAVQSAADLKSAFEAFQSNFAVMQSASLVGQTVAVNTVDGAGNSSTLTGKVGSIQVVKGIPQFTLIDPSTGKPYTGGNGQTLSFPTAQIVGIGSK